VRGAEGGFGLGTVGKGTEARTISGVDASANYGSSRCGALDRNNLIRRHDAVRYAAGRSATGGLRRHVPSGAFA